jgi:hypothetical protein
MVGLGRSEAAGITALVIVLLNRSVARARSCWTPVGCFDDFVNNEMRKVLVSQPEERDQREEAYRRARVATEMKAGLESLIETYEADAWLRKRREHTLGDRARR